MAARSIFDTRSLFQRLNGVGADLDEKTIVAGDRVRFDDLVALEN